MPRRRLGVHRTPSSRDHAQSRTIPDAALYSHSLARSPVFNWRSDLDRRPPRTFSNLSRRPLISDSKIVASSGAQRVRTSRLRRHLDRTREIGSHIRNRNRFDAYRQKIFFALVRRRRRQTGDFIYARVQRTFDSSDSLR